MPALDQCHDQVVHALEKAGWVVIPEPYTLASGKRTGYVDIQASRQVNGSLRSIMMVEVKCFPNPKSTTRELYEGIGQYMIYRAMLEEIQIFDSLYLAVPMAIFDDVFDPLVRTVLHENRIKLVVVDMDQETITQWIE